LEHREALDSELTRLKARFWALFFQPFDLIRRDKRLLEMSAEIAILKREIASIDS
jgi:hypothetical protein